MNKINRDQLLDKRAEVISTIENLENSNKSVRYTTNRYYEGFGMPERMSKATLVAAVADLKSRQDNTSDLLSELGFEVQTDEEKTYLGYTFEEWMNDFKLRAQVLRNEEKIAKLTEALAIIERNLSEDDRFALDMEVVANLL